MIGFDVAMREGGGCGEVVFGEVWKFAKKSINLIFFLFRGL